ncbi:MAG: DNA mismatch repair endonuclease MutL [Synechocystis sp.]|nr:DNA mismatch repair endonuclease MutL [Synechocystis sp.]
MIHVLSTELVDLIAAGEVIDSPIAVVRELVENALDAGATQILVRLWLNEWWLEVLDNGQGMTPEELMTCALPHSTSKIRELQDLQGVKTLGFRGEALHSLAQVSRLTIASRAAGSQEAGWRGEYDAGGQVCASSITAIATGTRVEVKNLFANFPHRRQALSNAQPIFKAIQTYIQRLALCHPHVTWQLWQGDRRRLTISPAPTPQGLWPQYLKPLGYHDFKTVEQTLELPEGIENSGEKARLTLTFGLPDRCHRRRPDWVVIGVNGRPVHCPELEQTLLGSFHRTLPRHRYPIGFAHFQLPPQWIDWNRHPAKTELYLQYLPHWQAQLKTLLTEGLRLTSATTTPTPPRINQLLKAAEPTGTYQLNAPSTTLTESVLNTPPPLTAIAQVNQTYIVVEHPHGVWLVEQHVAHERVLFEQLQQQLNCVALPQPVLIDHLSPDQVEQLQQIGIEIDSFGEDLWAVRSLPQLIREQTDPIPLLRELSQLDSLSLVQAAIACQSAIKNGTPLDLPAMKNLIDQWQQCHHPQTCPHGRPIYLALDESSLARFFRRNWLIGQ